MRPLIALNWVPEEVLQSPELCVQSVVQMRLGIFGILALLLGYLLNVLLGIVFACKSSSQHLHLMSVIDSNASSVKTFRLKIQRTI